MKNIVLTGLSGCGKSTLGEMAAKSLNIKFIDLDAFIEQHEGKKIKDIFSQNGESFFRKLESKALADCLQQQPCLIATGGGIVLKPENRAYLRDAMVIFIDRPVKNIMEDLKGDNSRPLLAAGLDKLHELERQRRTLYEQSADIVWLNNHRNAASALPFLMSIINAYYIDSGYAVIGDPIGHSLSPAIHGAVFKALGISEAYNLMHVPQQSLAEFVQKVRQGGIKGFNATIPLKKALISLLDEVDEEALLCGAVNTVVKRDGLLCGFNTDMDGLLFSLQSQGYGFYGRNLMLLGAGGVSSSVALKAAREKAAKITVLARQKDKAEEALAGARQISSSITFAAGEMSPRNISVAAADCSLLINCTPLGMHGCADDFNDLSFLEDLPSDSLVCDLIYKPSQTRFLKRAADLGLKTLNGLGMLIYQAIIADEIFLNKSLDRNHLYDVAARAASSG